MKLKFQNVFLAISAILLTALAIVPFQTVSAAVTTAPNSADLVAEINALRASNGLPALRVDPYLSASAQSHSQYQASIGTWTHTGAGGSTYTSRAIAAGYGGGQGVYVRENVAMITSSGSTSYIIYTLWADAVHWNTMLNTTVTDIGVGVAESSGWYYYTMDVGAVNGQSSSATAVPTQIGGGSPVTQPTTNQIAPIITSTPAPDGSVIHEVQGGQALWGIAVAYNTTADAIKKLNKLTGDIIYSGQKLVIQPSYTPTLSPTVTETPLPPTRTRTPTATPRTPTVTFTPSITPSATTAPLIPALESLDKRSLGIAIIAISGAGLVFITLGMILKRKK